MNISHVTARMRITVEVDCHSNWAADATASQVAKQAAEEAVGILARGNQQGVLPFRIVGEPEVFQVVSLVKGNQR